tara:strand:+ start:1319 stop:1606 length:288 start_codon:yes stop_codon:yes gene_type:complete
VEIEHYETANHEITVFTEEVDDGKSIQPLVPSHETHDAESDNDSISARLQAPYAYKKPVQQKKKKKKPKVDMTRNRGKTQKKKAKHGGRKGKGVQ